MPRASALLRADRPYLLPRIAPHPLRPGEDPRSMRRRIHCSATGRARGTTTAGLWAVMPRADED